MSTARRLATDYGIVVALVLLVVVVQTQSSTFLSGDNLANISEQWAAVAVMAIAMTFVLMGGGFDLSIGATYAVSATVCASLADSGPALALAAALGLGALIGLINALSVQWLNVNPFVATLAAALIVNGVAEAVSGGTSYGTDAALFDTLGTGEVAGIPVPLVVVAAVALLAGGILNRTVYGRSLRASGGNEEASYLSGIATHWVVGSTYVLSGMAAALAGAIYIGRVGSTQIGAGSGIEFDVIAAALIGGISIAGGEGAVWRALAGVSLLAVLQNFFNQANIDNSWQLVAKGVIILAAVALDAYGKRRVRKTDWRGVIRRRPRAGTQTVLTGASPTRRTT